MDSQISPLWFYSVYLHLHRIMNPPFHPLSVCPSANLSSFHLPHTETHQWGLHPSSFFHEIFSLPGHSFHTGAPVSIFVLFPQIYFIIYCTNTFTFSHFLFSSPLVTCFIFLPHATHVTLGWSIASHLPLSASSISSEYFTGPLPLPSEFVCLVSPLAHLILSLGIPLTLDLVTRLQPLIISYTLQPRAVLSFPTF
jgi:hypothetical protein